MEITREENIKWKAIEIIIRQMNVEPWKSTTGPFKILVRTIISQNTNDRNTDKAIELLERNIGIDPNSILSASKEHIVECLKPAGLYNVKAPRIINLAKILREELKDPNKINDMTKEDVTNLLLKVKGIGPKTIDVFLALSKNEDVLAVDTHIKRVSKRLGITNSKDTYFQIREKLERLVPSGKRIRAHFSLINFGRKICIARRPKCPICPVMQYCQSKREFYPNI
jgi:endonuclease-3